MMMTVISLSLMMIDAFLHTTLIGFHRLSLPQWPRIERVSLELCAALSALSQLCEGYWCQSRTAVAVIVCNNGPENSQLSISTARTMKIKHKRQTAFY